jgi:hypothetical protein
MKITSVFKVESGFDYSGRIFFILIYPATETATGNKKPL